MRGLSPTGLILTAFVLSTLLSISCSVDYAVIPPIREMSAAGNNMLWLITDERELIRLIGTTGSTKKIDFPAKPAEVFFLNDVEGWICDTGGWVWSTSDGGENWSKRGTNVEIGSQVSKLVFVDSKNGWLLSFFSIYTTNDGGDTWLHVYPDRSENSTKADGQPTCISTVGPDIAWVGFTNGFVSMTQDHGKTWKIIRVYGEKDTSNVSPKVDIASIHARSDREVWVGPGSGGVDGLYYSDDAGMRWKQLLTDPVRLNFGRSSMSFPPGKGAWLVGIQFVRDASSPEPTKSAIFHSDDGKLWQRTDDSFLSAASSWVCFPDELNGWIVGTDHQDNRSDVYRTEDSGRTWRKIYELKRPKRTS